MWNKMLTMMGSIAFVLSFSFVVAVLILGIIACVVGAAWLVGLT